MVGYWRCSIYNQGVATVAPEKGRGPKSWGLKLNPCNCHSHAVHFKAKGRKDWKKEGVVKVDGKHISYKMKETEAAT